MGRRAREPDRELAAQVREYMRQHGMSQGALAERLGVNKGTVSRSLSAASFSATFRKKVKGLLGVIDPKVDPVALLQESLRISVECAKLLDVAQVLMVRALDLAGRNH